MAFKLYRSLSKYAHQRKYVHPPFSLQVIAKGHLLLERMSTQQTEYVAACINMKSIVYVWAYYSLCMTTSRYTPAAAAEEDTVGEQQAEVDTIRERQLKQMQLGHSPV